MVAKQFKSEREFSTIPSNPRAILTTGLEENKVGASEVGFWDSTDTDDLETLLVGPNLSKILGVAGVEAMAAKIVVVEIGRVEGYRYRETGCVIELDRSKT